MKKISIFLFLFMISSTLANDRMEDNTEYTAFEIGVVNSAGSRADENFFVGPLPEIGQSVEFVYVGRSLNGNMRFQFHTVKSR